MRNPMSAQRLMMNLTLYFVLLFGGILAVLLILTGRSTSAGDAAVRQAPTAVR